MADERKPGSWLQWFVGMCLLTVAGYLVWDARDLLVEMRRANFGIFLIVIVLQIVYLVFQSERLRHCLRVHVRKDIQFSRWLHFHTAGRLLNSVVVQSGHVYQAVALKRSDDLPFSDLATVYVIQAWFATTASLAIATAFVGNVWPGVRVGLGFTLVVVLVAPLAGSLLGQSRLAAVIMRGKFGAALQRIVVGLGDGARSQRLILVLLVWTGLGFAVGLGVLWGAYLAAGVTLPWSALVLALAFMQVSNVVMITPGNLGIQELGLAAITELIGAGAGVGVIVSAVVRVSGVIALVLLAMAVAVITRFAPSSGPSSAQTVADGDT